MKKIFVSYSHKDEEWKQRFEEILKPALINQADLEWWYDGEVEVSDDWHEKIQAALHQSDLYVCLVSPAFLASQYISHNELPEILRRREQKFAEIACLYLQDSLVDRNECAIKVDLGDGADETRKLTNYQGLNSPELPIAGINGKEKQNAALNQAAHKLLDLIKKLKPKPSPAKEPRERFELTIKLKRNGNSINISYFDYSGLILDRKDDSKRLKIILENWRKLGQTQLTETVFTDSLFTLLFGEGDQDCSLELLKIVADAGTADRPSKHALRVRLYFEDSEIAALPWSATSYRGEPLRDCQWLFELHAFMPKPGQSSELSVSCKHPLPTLILNPAANSTSGTPGSGIVQVLKAPFKKFARPTPKTYQNWQQLKSEPDAAIPELVYFVGRASMDSGKIFLHFHEDDREQRVAVSDLLNINSHLPKILFLNLLCDIPIDCLILAQQLAGRIPVVLIQQAEAIKISELERNAVKWLNTWMDQGGNPIAAFHRVDLCQGQAFGAYQSFESARMVAPGSAKKDLAILLLNRHTQRAAISTELRKIVTGKDHRVLFAPVCAEAGNQIERFPDQLLDTLQSSEGLADLATIQPVALEWPQQGLSINVTELERLLKKCLQSEPDRDLQKVLDEHRPNAPDGRGSVLLLYWPTLNQYPGKNELDQIEYFLSGRLAPKCPPNLRILILLLVEIEASQHSKLAEYAEDMIINYSEPGFITTKIDPLDNVSRPDLVQYLNRYEDTRCPNELIRQLSQLIIDRTEGRFSETVKLLEDGMLGWYDLRDDLIP